MFVWTLALELPVYAVLLKERLRSPGQALVMVLCLNLLTHPLLTIVDPPSIGLLLCAEGVVALVEAGALGVWLGRAVLARGTLASVAANALSTAAGLAFSAWVR